MVGKRNFLLKSLAKMASKMAILPIKSVSFKEFDIMIIIPVITIVAIFSASCITVEVRRSLHM